MSAETDASMGCAGAEPVGRRAARVDVSRLRRIGRAAVLGGSHGGVPDAIEHLVRAYRAHHPGSRTDGLRRAYQRAEAAHRGQMRKSGEPYITHPVAVTLILAELGAGSTTLIASLLHDTVEDTEVTLAQVHREFGPEVGHLVDGVTKLEKLEYGAAAESETFRKMLVAAGADVRVMSIKLADRLHNMRTLGVMRPEKQARIARVTRDVLIPFAERLGVHAVKTELEDLVFAILHPREHQRATRLIDEHRRAPDPLAVVAEEVSATLREAGIGAEVVLRPRHVLSVHRAGVKRDGLGPCDFARLLVLVGENADCYAALGELRTCFTPVVPEFKDFIAAPKFNLYQSLHTAIADTDGRQAEVLIRTHRMHRVAETGVIALGDPHGGAEGAAGEDGLRADPTRPGWLSRLLAWQEEAPDPDTFWTELRDDLAQDREITVFDEEPGGPPLQLPFGASCVDAAYGRHGRAAHSCVGVRVNGRLAGLGTVLRDGDTVRLLLAADGTPGPSPQWLEHAHTPAARIALRGWLDDRRPEAAEPRQGGGQPLPAAAEEGPGPHPPEPREAAAVADGDPERSIRLARCCTPIPPDRVTGFAVRGGGVTVHRDRCPVTRAMTDEGRPGLPISWRSARVGCRVRLRAEALGRRHLLADLTEALAVHGATVLAAEVEPPREHRVRHTYTLRLPDASGLPGLMRAMRRVPGVYDVGRVLHVGGAPVHG